MKINSNKLSNKQIDYLKLINTKISLKGFYKINNTISNKLKVILDLEELTNNKNEAIIAIDGMSGSGKSTFANELSKIFDTNIFHIDDFFQKPVISEHDELSKFGSNINYELINTSIINNINKKLSISYKPFNFKTHSHLDAITVNYKKINIIEGSFSMHPKLINNYEYMIYMKVGFIKQRYRIYKRSGLKRLIKFIKIWIPNENKYNKALEISKKANIIVK